MGKDIGKDQEVTTTREIIESETPKNITSRGLTKHKNKENSTTVEDTASENEEELTTLTKKRKKGVIQREQQRKRKNLGLDYINRKRILVPAKEFNPIVQCCNKKCFEKCNIIAQEAIFSNFITEPPEIQKQVLCDRMTIFQCKSHCKGKGTKGGKSYDRVTPPMHIIWQLL